MKEQLKKVLPHLAAILLFIGLAITYLSPIVFENKEILQGDIIGASGWGKDLKDYHKETGEYAFWSNSMFGGMPANFAYMPPTVDVFYKLSSPFYRFFTQNIFVIILFLIGFYILLIALGCRPTVAFIGAFAYAFASFNLISIGAGHVNKCLVMATMAPVIGGIILCYRKKYLWGTIITLLFTGLNITWGHQQISFYLLLVILILATVYLVYAIKEKTLNDFFKSSIILLVVALLAISPSLGRLITTADYTKDTMRGGAVLKTEVEGKKESSGLDIDYAFQWSYGKAETMTLLIPNFYGGSSHYNIGKESNSYEVLKPTGQANQFSKHAPMYWGTQPFTGGPVYVGAIICFLFVLGLQIVKGREKWWLLFATLLSIILAWGKNFEAVNTFLFHYLPLYNKFRAPTMAFAIAEVTMATLAILALKVIMEKRENPRELARPLLISAGVTGGLCLLFALFGSFLMSFSAPGDAQYANFPELISALEQDRKQMLSVDAWRSFFLIALSFGAIWFYIKKSYTANMLILIMGILIVVDIWPVDKRFLNDDSFVPKKRAMEIVATPADSFILQDKDPNYRVLNLAKSTFNEAGTSYFHKSIGGYSPAKLRRYQDIIDYHFSQGINSNVLNMLNTRYVIVPTQEGPQVQTNPEALGNAWFVNEIKWVNSPDEEIIALNDFDPSKTAYIDVAWKESFPSSEQYTHAKDSSAVIQLTDYVNPGHLIYKSSSKQPHLAVFSEVFYKTWRATIDGKEVAPIRVNYILRGLPIPEGDHTIEFTCVDEVFLKSAKLSLISSILVGLILAGLFGFALFQGYKKRKNTKPSIVQSQTQNANIKNKRR